MKIVYNYFSVSMIFLIVLKGMFINSLSYNYTLWKRLAGEVVKSLPSQCKNLLRITMDTWQHLCIMSNSATPVLWESLINTDMLNSILTLLPLGTAALGRLVKIPVSCSQWKELQHVARVVWVSCGSKRRMFCAVTGALSDLDMWSQKKVMC